MKNERQKIVDELVKGTGIGTEEFWRMSVNDVLDAQERVIKEDLKRAIEARNKANGGYSKAGH